MYSNKQLAKISKCFLRLSQNNEYFLQNLNLSKRLSLLNFAENSVFWSAKRFKFLQSFGTNVQYNEYINAPTSEKKKLTNDSFNSLFLIFNSVLNSRYTNNFFLEYYNFVSKNIVSTSTVRNSLQLESTPLLTNLNFMFLLPNQLELRQVSINPRTSIFNFTLIYDSSCIRKALFLSKNQKHTSYMISLADKLLFTQGYSSLFLGYVGNSVLSDKYLLRSFNNIKKL